MKKKILIIEDDESTSEILQFISHELNCEVITSTYSLSVLQIADLCPNIILLDHWLGDSLGSELCLKLKSTPETKDIPILIISAHHSLSQIAKDNCADDYVQKPFLIDDLQEKIRQVLK